MDPVYLDKSSEKIRSRISTLEKEPDGVGFCLGLWRGLRPSEEKIRDRINKAWKKRRASSVGTIWFTVSVWMNSGLLPFLIEWTKIFDNKPIKLLFKTAYTSEWGKLTPWGTNYPGNLNNLGKLAFLPEAAGKVRVVAMVDVLTQSILHPLHEWIFLLLKEIPQDGTHNQRRPIELLNSLGIKELFSYDLSSATDRLPLAIQQAILEPVLGERVASLWAILLVGRNYSFHPRTATKWNLPVSSVRYAAGQPMGAYSSWAMLALTHHFIVQLAAYEVYGAVVWFTKYAVLGDDIVIGDKAVAKVYFRLMTEELGVKIQETKSLISDNGSFEFAKKTFIRGEEVSPISLKGFQAGLRNLPVMESIVASLPGISSYRLKDIVRTLGFGYKVLGRLQSALHKRSRLQGLIVFLMRPGGLYGDSWSRWLSADNWLVQGSEMTPSSLNEIYKKVGELRAERLSKQIAARLAAFQRDSKAGWFPTTQFPTRILFDRYAELVLRPISKDLKDRLTNIEVLVLQWRKRCDVTLDEFNLFMKDLDGILEEVDLLPSTPKVARRSDPVPPIGSQVIKLWRSLRGLVRKD